MACCCIICTFKKCIYAEHSVAISIDHYTLNILLQKCSFYVTIWNVLSFSLILISGRLMVFWGKWTSIL